jgi:hypothetical protein
MVHGYQIVCPQYNHVMRCWRVCCGSERVNMNFRIFGTRGTFMWNKDLPITRRRIKMLNIHALKGTVTHDSRLYLVHDVVFLFEAQSDWYLVLPWDRSLVGCRTGSYATRLASKLNVLPRFGSGLLEISFSLRVDNREGMGITSLALCTDGHADLETGGYEWIQWS